MASEVKYRITAEDNTEPGTKSATGHLNTFESAIKKVGLAIAAVFAVNKVVDFFKDSAKAAMEAEASQARFQAALMATGKTHEISTAKINAYASALQKVTKFEDDTIVSTLGQLQSLADLNESGLMKVTPAMLDFGEAIGSVDTAANLIGKTLSSSINALGRYGIQVDMNASKEERLAQITEQLRAKYGGLAEIMGQTAVGRLAQLKNAWGDVQEEVGRFLLAGAKPLVEALTNISNGIKNFMQDTEKMKGFASIVSDISAGAAVLLEMGKMFASDAWKYVSSIFKTLGDALTVVSGKGKESNTVFTMLGGVMQVITAAFAIQARLINVWIMGFARLIDAVLKSADILSKFFAMLGDPLNEGKRKGFDEALKTAGTAWADFGKGLINDIGGVINEVTTQINGFMSETTKKAQDLQNTWTNTKATVENGISTPLSFGNYGSGPMQNTWSDNGAQGDMSKATQYTGMGGYQGSEGMGLKGNDFISIIINFVKDLFGQVIDNWIGQLKDTLQPIMEALSSAISPIIKGLNALMKAILPIVKVIIDSLGPALEFIGNIFIGIGKFIATIFNGIAAVINFLLGWAGVNIQYIDVGAIGQDSGSGSSSGSSGGGSAGTTTAQYTAAPVITMNINIYATAITAGDKIMTLEDLALLLKQKADEALELK